MMTHRKFNTVATIVAALAIAFPCWVNAQEKLPVVATFSILGDMVSRIGGDAVLVTTLVGRNGDTHVYQPTPADAKAVKNAQVIFANGLGFEGWLDRLTEAAEFDGDRVVATNGINTISYSEHDDEEHHKDEHAESKEDHRREMDEHTSDADAHENEEHEEGHDDHHHGEYDPHGWQSLKNAIVYVDNITSALSKASPSNAGTFYKNREAYMADIELLDTKIKEMIATLPSGARTIVTSHDAFQYFGRDYGLRFLAPQGLSTESEASARDVAQLIKQIRAQSISAVFVENVADPRLVQQIATETGSIVGGKLFPGALSSVDGPAGTYLDLMNNNATTIVNALTKAQQP